VLSYNQQRKTKERWRKIMQKPITIDDDTVVKLDENGVLIRQYDEIKDRWDSVYLTKEQLRKIVELIK
jgi:hypothetical protein